jgi:PST family polysaccharide transporter
VALPVLSRLQDDHARAGEFIKRGQLAFGYTICAALAITAGGSGPIVQLVLGGRWSAVAPVLTFLAIAGASTMLAFVGFWVYVSRGLGAQLLRYTMATAVLQSVCVVGGSWWGVDGVAAGFMTAAIIEWPLSLCWLSRLTSIPLGDLLRAAARITACGAAAGTAAWGVTQLPADPAAPVNVLFCAAAGVAVYLLAAVLVPAVRRDLRAVALVARKMAARGAVSAEY